MSKTRGKNTKVKPEVQRDPMLVEKGHDDHPKPTTRREFLAQGFLTLSTWTVLPNLYQLLGKSALAASADCPASLGSGLIPFIVFDGAGGLCVPASFAPVDKGGQYLNSYSSLGLGTASSSWSTGNDNASSTIDTQFGAKAVRNLGLISTASGGFASRNGRASGGLAEGLFRLPANVRSKLKITQVASISRSDTGANRSNPVGLVTKFAQYSGSQLPNPTGLRNSNCGGNSQCVIPAQLKALQISDLSSLQNALSLGTSYNGLSQNQRVALVRGMEKLSDIEKQRIASMSGGEALSTMIKCGLVKNEDYAGPAQGVDPLQDATFVNAYNGVVTRNAGDTALGVNALAAGNNAEIQRAVAIYNALNGNTGPTTVTFGGCDYHLGRSQDANATTNAPDNVDLLVGATIARTLEAAAAMNKPLFFVLITDGSCSSRAGTRIMAGDNDTRCQYLMGYFNPNTGVQQVLTQIGAYTQGQSVDLTASVVGQGPEQWSFVAAYNYLKLNGALISPTALVQFVANARNFGILNESILAANQAFV